MKTSDGIRTGLVAASLAASFCASAAPISVSRTYHFLDNVSTNSLGIRSGMRQQFGSNCVVLTGNACTPQNLANSVGTSVTATQGSTGVQLFFVASDLTSNRWAAAPSPIDVPDGEWTIKVSNGTHTGEARSPTLASSVPMGFAKAVAIQQNGLTATRRRCWAQAVAADAGDPPPT